MILLCWDGICERFLPDLRIVHYNFYNREELRTIILKLGTVASGLRKHELESLGEKQFLHLRTYRMERGGTEQIPEGMMERIAEFYERFAERLRRMLNESIEADFLRCHCCEGDTELLYGRILEE